MKIECTCKQCGKTFYKPQWAINRGEGRFCSLKCFSQSRVTKIERTCVVCGKIFYVIPSEINKGGGKFCSKSCKNHQLSYTNAKYTVDQLNVLNTVFATTGDCKQAALTSGINVNYARKLLLCDQNPFKITDDNKITVISANSIRKFSDTLDHADKMNEFVKSMPLNYTEAQAKLYAIGYCDAKMWGNAVKSKILHLIHRTYKLQRNNSAIHDKNTSPLPITTNGLIPLCNGHVSQSEAM
jgi:hypothetical protein